MPRDVGVVVAAAGRGERVGGSEPKQFRPIGGIPMLLRALRPFAQHPRVAEIVVALPPDLADGPPQWLADLTGERLRIVKGGSARADSVCAGVAVLDAACAIVLVHDAARPFVDPQTVDAVIAVAARGVAAVPAVPVSDTLKRTTPGTIRVAETVVRTGLWRAQTPQAFPRDMLVAAFGTFDADRRRAFTDEAAMMEEVGHAVEIVPDVSTNIKITTAEDFALAEAVARG